MHERHQNNRLIALRAQHPRGFFIPSSFASTLLFTALLPLFRYAKSRINGNLRVARSLCYLMTLVRPIDRFLLTSATFPVFNQFIAAFQWRVLYRPGAC